MARAGYDVTLVIPHDRAEECEGIRIIPITKASRLFQRFIFSSRNAVMTAVREKADIYHLHDPELLLWKGALLRTGSSVVYDMHEDLPHQIQDKDWIPKIIRGPVSMLAGWFERILMKGTRVIFAEESYAVSRPWLRNPVEILNFPRIDLLGELFRTKQEGKNEDYTFGYIGAVTEGRGSLATIEALGELKRREVCARFHCVGRIFPEHRQELAFRIGELDLRDVNYFGYLPPRQGWEIMAACDAGLAILEPLPNYVKSYPTKMFEYMALGLPVIVSNFPLYSRIVDRFKCGLTVDPMDPKAIAEAMVYLAENPEEGRAMGARGREAVLDHFNWASQEKRLLTFYADLGHQGAK